MKTKLTLYLLVCSGFLTLAPDVLSQQNNGVTTRHVETVVFEDASQGVYKSRDGCRTWHVVRPGSGTALQMAQRWPVSTSGIEFDDGRGNVVFTVDPIMTHWQAAGSLIARPESHESTKTDAAPSEAQIRYLAGQVQALEVLVSRPGFYVVEVVSVTTGIRKELHRGQLSVGRTMYGPQVLHALPAGLYVCRVSGSGGTVSMSFVVQE